MIATNIENRIQRSATTDWDEVYRSELPRVYNFFRYRVGDRDLAEDLTSATFEKAWRNRERYRHDRAGFATWLLAIARNVANDHFRRHRAHTPLDQVGEPVAPMLDDAVDRMDEIERLGALLATLAPRERELVALKYGAGETNRAISKLLGMTESNVGTTLHRIVQRMRAQWEV